MPIMKGVRQMAKLTNDDVRNLAKEWGVKFIRLQFTDIFWDPQNVCYYC